MPMSETAGQPEGPLSPTARRRALVICNGNFEHLNLNLAGVSKDAENLTRLLGDKERAGFEVTCLLDKGLLRVRKAIAKACGDSGKDDTLLIYYSGTSMCEDNGELLIPVADSDNESLMATCIEPDFILSQMRRSDCRRFVLVIDGCHSGAFFRNNRGIPDGLFALTSCAADEVSMDTAEGGAFTQSFIRAVTTRAGGDGTVTVDDAYESIRRDSTLVGDARTHPQKWVWNLPEPIVLTRSTMSVFLSYSRDDTATADMAVGALESHGIAVWRDISGIPGGADWRDSLVAALAKSQAVVFMMSAEAFESKWVRRELEFADGKGLPVVPVCAGPIEPPEWFQFSFGARQRVIFQPGGNGDASLDLASAVRGAAAKPTP
jgi:hypothetical protein